MSTQTEAILLHIRPQGENAFLAIMFSQKWGKIAGFVKGGRKKAAQLQVGNILEVERFRRLETQLGTLSCDVVASPAAACYNSLSRLQMFHYLAEVLDKGLEDEEPHPNLYRATRDLLTQASVPGFWDRLAFYELQLLASLGYGLSLSKESAVPCAQNAPLKYVSPKSGRAVSAAMGQAYHDQLLPLPALFGGLSSEENAPKTADFLDVFKLTGHFLDRALHGKHVDARKKLIEYGAQSAFNE